MSHSFWANNGGGRRVHEDQKGAQDHRSERNVIHCKILKDELWEDATGEEEGSYAPGIS